MAQPVDSPKHPTDSRRINQTGSQKSADLNHDIWGRYDGSPGVLPLSVTQGLAKRVSLFRNSQLPLLSHLQRHRTMAEGLFPSSLSELPYARLSALTGLQSPSIQGGQAVAAAPSTRLGLLGPATMATVPAFLLRSVVTAQPALNTPAALKEGHPAHPLQAGARTDKRRTASLQRRLDGPGEKPLQRQEASSAGVSVTSQIPARQAPQSGARVSTSLDAASPPGRGAQPATEAPEATPFSGTETRMLGKAILQRRPSRSMEEPLQRQDTGPGPALPNKSLGPQNFDQGADFRAPHTLALPARTATEASLPIAGRPIVTEARMNQIVQRSAEGPEPMVEDITISERKSGPALPFARTALPGIGTPGGRVNQDLYPTSSELPFSRASGPGAIRGGEGISALPVVSGAPMAAILQRAEAQTSTNGTLAPEISGTNWSPSASKPALPTPAASRLEGPELERLADSVYTIIERRLILERESRGF